MNISKIAGSIAAEHAIDAAQARIHARILAIPRIGPALDAHQEWYVRGLRDAMSDLRPSVVITEARPADIPTFEDDDDPNVEPVAASRYYGNT